MTRDFKPVQLASGRRRASRWPTCCYATGHMAEATTAYKALQGPEASEGHRADGAG